MNRRNLLSAGPALIGLAGAGLAAAAAAPNPDADLLAVCAEFNACDLRQRAIYDGPNAIEDDGKAGQAAAPIFARMDALLDRMEHLWAATSVGIAARAGSLAQHSGGREFSFDAQGTITGRLLDYLMRDGAALGGADAAPSACPDAALIALCATFHRQHAEAYDEANLDWEAASDAKHRTFVEVGKLTPSKEAGHRAKAAVAVVMLAENHEPDGNIADPEALFALNLLRDWLGRA
jgi:hypothetical protein